MARSLLREVIELAVFVRGFRFRGFRKLFECFNEDLPKLALISATVHVSTLTGFWLNLIQGNSNFLIHLLYENYTARLRALRRVLFIDLFLYFISCSIVFKAHSPLVRKVPRHKPSPDPKDIVPASGPEMELGIIH